MISVVCPYCKEEYDLPDDYVGCKVACDNCEGRFFILDAAGRTQAAYQKTNKDSDTQKSFEEKYTKCPGCQTEEAPFVKVDDCPIYDCNLKMHLLYNIYFNKIKTDFNNVFNVLCGYIRKIYMNISKGNLSKISIIILIFSTICLIFSTVIAINAREKIKMLEIQYSNTRGAYKDLTLSTLGNIVVRTVFNELTPGSLAGDAFSLAFNIGSTKEQEDKICGLISSYREEYRIAFSFCIVFFTLILASGLWLIVNYFRSSRQKACDRNEKKL